MLSHIVTAAKGLFSTQELAEEDPATTPHDQASAILPERPKIMVSTRRTRYGTADAEDSSNTGTSSDGSGKRKSRSTLPNNTESQPKKRKTSSEANSAIAVVVNDTPDTRQNGTIDEEADSTDGDGVSVAPTTGNSKSPSGVTEKSTHMRFGSEEYIPAPNGEVDTVPETNQPEAGDDESSDDDEAPETLDNTTQLANMKATQQNAEQAKLRYHSHERSSVLLCVLIVSLDTNS